MKQNLIVKQLKFFSKSQKLPTYFCSQIRYLHFRLVREAQLFGLSKLKYYTEILVFMITNDIS